VDGGAIAPRGGLSPVEREVADCDENDTCRIGFGYKDYRHLPTLSLVYGITENQNGRLAYSQTLSFPEYREMAPLLYFNYQQALETVGNFELKPTLIHNYDARWEWFPRPGDLFALSGFYKYFEDPVELNIRQVSSNFRSDFVNAPSAFLFGAETEARIGLGALMSSLTPFQFLGNFTWIYSEVDGRRKRAMQGQSPYLINAILFFEPENSPWQASILYNRIGPRIAKVGLGSFPDIQDESRQSLEAGLSYHLGRGVKAKLSGKNLLAENVKQTQGGLLIREYKTGRKISAGISYAFR
jgi:outer membrane receptor protein involved in Fe transport